MSKLDFNTLLGGMADALPTHPKDDDSSDLASSYEVIALLVHSYLTALGFKFCGFDEEKPLLDAESYAPRLPPQWNNGFGSFSFAYRHKQSLMTFFIRVDRMGTKAEVRGLAVGHEKTFRFEKPVRDIVKSAGLPIRITMTEEGEDRSDLVSKLRNTFISEEAFHSFIRDLKVNIVQQLIPKLQSEDYIEEEAEAHANAQAERRAQEARHPHRPFADTQPRPNEPYPMPGLLPEMARPRPGPVPDFPPPDFEDEHQMRRPPRGPIMPPGQSPFNIGHDDLNPPGLGPHDPLRGSFVGGGLPRPGGGAGMHPTFDDPLFTGQGRRGPGGYGQQGYDPQAPPGARWDPTSGDENPRFPGPGSGSGYNPYGGGSGGFGGYGGFGGGGII